MHVHVLTRSSDKLTSNKKFLEEKRVISTATKRTETSRPANIMQE